MKTRSQTSREAREEMESKTSLSEQEQPQQEPQQEQQSDGVLTYLGLHALQKYQQRQATLLSTNFRVKDFPYSALAWSDFTFKVIPATVLLKQPSWRCEPQTIFMFFGTPGLDIVWAKDICGDPAPRWYMTYKSHSLDDFIAYSEPTYEAEYPWTRKWRTRTGKDLVIETFHEPIGTPTYLPITSNGFQQVLANPFSFSPWSSSSSDDNENGDNNNNNNDEEDIFIDNTSPPVVVVESMDDSSSVITPSATLIHPTESIDVLE
jgi:hypothetical protein